MKKRLLHGFVFLMLLTFLFCHSYALDTVSIEATRIMDNIYKLLVDDFVNMVAFIGPNGVLLVDTGFDESSGEVKSILTKLGGGEIKYIINTHSDYDHIAGNSALREKAIVMAHTRCKSRLIQYADPEYDIPFDKALFRNAYPTITVDDTIKLYFNGEEIQIIPLTGGHTDEDIIVYFKNLGVVCLGDVIIPGSFPVVKNENGGNAHALLKNVERLITLFPDDVIFIVGHGHDMTVKELRSYHDMLRSTISIVNEAMKENMTVDEMKQMNILEDWSSFDNPTYRVTTSEAWIETIFRSSEDKRQEIKIQTLTGPYLGQEPPGIPSRDSEHLPKIVNDGYGDYLLVPAGEFEMGDNFNEGNPDELPVHKIYLSDYYIGKYEVTNREYKQFMDDGGYKNPAFWTAGGFGEFGTQPLYWDNNTDADPRNGQRGTTFYKGRNVHGGGIPGHENFPVNGVSWYEAMAYCSWLSSKTGQKYRLPTEAEWEKAARGSYEQNRDNPELRHQRRYPWGDDFDNSYGNFWNSGDPFDNGTAPVGYYDGTKHGPYQTKDNASPYGAYDMAGNVFEWCLDFYVRMNKNNPHSSVDYQERFERGTVTDPRGPSSGEEACLRSSDWHHNAVSEKDKYYHNPRSAFRNFDPPHWRGANFGFRCVREK